MNQSSTHSGEHDLNRLMAQMSPKLASSVYVFCSLDSRQAQNHSGSALMVFNEAEGVTLIVKKDYADSSGLEYEFPCCCITLEIHSALEAVGFLAAIVPALARQGMGVNPVSGFYHDHLFVPANRADDAMEVLKNLSRDAKANLRAAT